jgi:hypothetical protein
MSKSLVQRVAVFLCAVLLLCVAITPGVAGHTLAILACLWAVLSVALFLELASFEEKIPLQQAPALTAFSPRPPPAR